MRRLAANAVESQSEQAVKIAMNQAPEVRMIVIPDMND